MGSLPSARITASCVRIAELPGGKLFGIAQYIPHRANAVSKNSTVLFIGGVSEADLDGVAAEVYAFGRRLPVATFA